MTKSGSSAALTNILISGIKTRKGTLLVTWLMGIIIFFDDYFNALITVSTMRPVSDKHKISRERLSYSIDSTAWESVCCLLYPVGLRLSYR
jgi:Na+/H+ antiporter NhaC